MPISVLFDKSTFINSEWTTYYIFYCMGEREQEYKPEPLIGLGQVVGTPGALEDLINAEKERVELMLRHVTGDWGDLDDEDKEENESSVKEGFRILSACKLETGIKVWIITECDLSATTILLPD
jgi:hypothetical protein